MDYEMEKVGTESKRVTFRFANAETDPEYAWMDDYEHCGTRAVEALEKNRRMRRHFSVIEVAEEDDTDTEKLCRPRANTFFTRAKHHRKSIELKVIDSGDVESKRTPAKQAHLIDESGIWGSHSWTVDSKNLHPEVAELLEAAAAGDNDKMKEILEEHNSSRRSVLNFNSVDLLGRCALHLAVYNNHFETANILINQGVLIDLWDKEKKATPLICAAAIGQVALVELLLANGADVNNGFDQGNTALLWAGRSGSFECIKKIMEAGARQNPPLMYCETVLHVVAANGDYESVKLLLENGADVSLRKGDARNTALHLAAQECYTSCCELLLDYKADIDSQNAKGETALHISALKDVDTLNLLLARGASVKLIDNEGRTALFYAIDKTDRYSYAPECVEQLLEHNSDINIQDNLGLCPLHIAALKEAKECASILVKHNANVALVSKAGTSAFSLMLRKIPDTKQFIRNHLNDSVIVIRDTNDSSCKVKLDFRTIAPNGCVLPIHPTNQFNRKSHYSKSQSCGKESELIKCFLSTGQNDILLHPLVEAFLTLKWQKVRKFFYCGILLKVVLVILFSYFMISLYVDCVDKEVFKEALNKNKTFLLEPNETAQYGIPSFINASCSTVFVIVDSPKSAPDPDKTPDTPDERECFKSKRPLWITTWSLVVCFAIILIVQELTQLFQSFTTYIKYIESWIFWAFILSLCITCTFLPRDGKNFVIEAWQQAFAAVSVFLAWIFVLIQLGKFPSSGTLVQMFIKVFCNFARCFGAYSLLIMAFALAFCILFPVQANQNHNPYRNPWLAFAKVIRMMAGDVNPEPHIFDTPFTWVVHVLHTVFIIMITIVLMNLLVGLAVADIQGMYRDARLLRLSRQAALIYHLESSFLSPSIMNCIPRSLAVAIQSSILILPYIRNGCFYFKPYDYRDVKLPEYLQLSTLKMTTSSGVDQKNAKNEDNSEINSTGAVKALQFKLNTMQKQLDSILEKLESLSAK